MTTIGTGATRRSRIAGPATVVCRYGRCRRAVAGRRPSRWSAALGDLLHRPLVAVRIAEAGEPTPGMLLDLAGVDAAFDEEGAGGIGVVDDDLQPLERARLTVDQPGADRDRARRP